MSSLSFRLPLRSAAAIPARPQVIGRVMKWVDLRRSRSALAQLDTRLLKDIGISEQDAQTEYGRPFWQE